MKYVSMMPATDWFFVHKNEVGGGKGEHTIHHLAAWALTDDGGITGLLPISDHTVKNGTTAKLVLPPPIHGNYVHREQLTASMRQCLAAQE